MKICFIAGMLGQGGAERQLYNIIKTIKKKGFYVDLYCFQKGAFWEKPIKELDVKVVFIGAKGRIARIKELLSYIKQENYEYIHSQHFYTNLYAVVIAWLCNTKCIGSIRSDAFSEVKSMGLLGWLSLILPSVLTANSYNGKKNAQLMLRKEKSIFLLPNCVDLNIFYPMYRIRKENDSFKAIIVGTILKTKRIDRVIQIAEIISRRSKRKISFEIFGDGDLLKEMIEKARTKNLYNTTVYFKGRSSSIQSELRLADVLLITSDREGTPNVALEAMACGLPILATRVGDIPQLVKDGITGYSVEVKEFLRLVEFIEFLYDNPSKCHQMGEQANRLVNRQFSFERLENTLSDLYK